MPTLLRRNLLLAIALLFSSATSQAQLERTYAAHGGLELWRTFRAVEFDLAWTMNGSVRTDQHTFDLRSRDGLIKAANYELGANKGEVWIKPGTDALEGTPPRFYMWTPFYFFVMPFVFADPGAQLEDLGLRNVGGVEYDAVKVTFKAGTGDSPEDFYVAYLKKPSGQLKIVSYIVTYPALRRGKAIGELEQHAIVFEEWASGGQISFPRLCRLFHWKDDNLEGESLGTLEFSNVRYSSESLEPDRFKKPADAVIAPLQ